MDPPSNQAAPEPTVDGPSIRPPPAPSATETTDNQSRRPSVDPPAVLPSTRNDEPDIEIALNWGDSPAGTLIANRVVHDRAESVHGPRMVGLLSGDADPVTVHAVHRSIIIRVEAAPALQRHIEHQRAVGPVTSVSVTPK